MDKEVTKRIVLSIDFNTWKRTFIRTIEEANTANQLFDATVRAAEVATYLKEAEDAKKPDVPHNSTVIS